jgi:acyl-coenzyme A synthetase/AMP-(fatty) acid ligase
MRPADSRTEFHAARTARLYNRRLLPYCQVIKRLIFWEFARGSWQYDVVVILILTFIFATPKAWFRDQPRIPNASNIAMISTENGVTSFFVAANLLEGVSDAQQATKLTELLQMRTGDRKLAVTRVEPVHDSEGDLWGYKAFARR